MQTYKLYAQIMGAVTRAAMASKGGPSFSSERSKFEAKILPVQSIVRF